jgi:hypothetical protein
MKVVTIEHKHAILLVLLFLAIAQLMPIGFAVSSDQANEVIEQVDRNLGLAYVAVTEAERGGANVSLLLSKLQIAGNLLSEANIAFRIGDYDSASSYAEASAQAIEGVAEEGARLKMDAEREQIDSFLLTVVLSVVGVVLVLILGLLGWHHLKHVYFKRILGTKPQVEKK